MILIRASFRQVDFQYLNLVLENDVLQTIIGLKRNKEGQIYNQVTIIKTEAARVSEGR